MRNLPANSDITKVVVTLEYLLSTLARIALLELALYQLSKSSKVVAGHTIPLLGQQKS